ncbi:hypothetical protein [Pseudomonas eucalypticola]|nr:hypothetical protein [Pseudomonas eucalypticola]
MSYGMRIWGADGALQIDETSFTMRVVLSVEVLRSAFPAGQSYQTFSVPGITTANAVATVVPIGTYANYITQFETEVLADSVRVYNYIRGYAGTFTSTATSMRLIVIRFK